MRSIARGSNYGIRSLWINAHTYNKSFHFFFGGGRRERIEGWSSAFLWVKRGIGLRWFISQLFLSREVGGWTGIKNGGWGRVVMVRTLIICVRLSVWA